MKEQNVKNTTLNETIFVANSRALSNASQFSDFVSVFFYIAVVVAVVVAASLLFLHHIEFVLMCVSFRTYRRYIRQPNEVSMYFEWSLYVVDCFLFLFSSSSLVIFFRLFASRIVYHFLFMLDMACCVCIPWTETHR